MREWKHYELRRTQRPGSSQRLSNTVAVVDETGTPGYAYIAFSESFVTAVGNALPRGINDSTEQAYLTVTYNPLKRIWDVRARYITGVGQALLWHSLQCPAWINIIRIRGSDGKKTPPRSED
jgi:hypothetical protein